MTQATLKKMYQLLLTEPHAPTVCAQLERIAREALAEHAMCETQRLGQEIEQCQCPECQIKPHASDCAVHSEPAYPKGKCDCGAQPEQEPVATVTSETGADITMSWWHEPALPVGTKLYTHPPQRTWVGLNEDEIDYLIHLAYTGDEEFVQTIEAKLKEKNT